MNSMISVVEIFTRAVYSVLSSLGIPADLLISDSIENSEMESTEVMQDLVLACWVNSD